MARRKKAQTADATKEAIDVTNVEPATTTAPAAEPAVVRTKPLKPKPGPYLDLVGQLRPLLASYADRQCWGLHDANHPDEPLLAERTLGNLILATDEISGGGSFVVTVLFADTPNQPTLRFSLADLGLSLGEFGAMLTA